MTRRRDWVDRGTRGRCTVVRRTCQGRWVFPSATTGSSVAVPMSSGVSAASIVRRSLQCRGIPMAARSERCAGAAESASASHHDLRSATVVRRTLHATRVSSPTKRPRSDPVSGGSDTAGWPEGAAVSAAFLRPVCGSSGQPSESFVVAAGEYQFAVQDARIFPSREPR